MRTQKSPDQKDLFFPIFANDEVQNESRNQYNKNPIRWYNNLMIKFSKNQNQTIAQIFGNISAAWFSIGVISPIFLKTIELQGQIGTMIFGLAMATFFAIIAVMIAGRKKQ